MTHVIKTAAGNRILSDILSDEEPDINDLEDLETELEEARAYAASLLDRIWSLGQELERVRTALHSGGLDVERLALAIAEDDDFSLGWSKMYEPEAARIAAEYARLPAEAER